MITVVGIGGEPATGKTTLMREAMTVLGESTEFKYKLCRGHKFTAAKVLVLGIYDGTKFAGTDRLSMAVQPDAVALVEKMSHTPSYNGWTLLYEGDRLFNSSFIQAVANIAPHRFYLLTASDEQKEQRHLKRQDSQPAKWLAGRATKCKNITEQCAFVMKLRNETPADRTANLRRILQG